MSEAYKCDSCGEVYFNKLFLSWIDVELNGVKYFPATVISEDAPYDDDKQVEKDICPVCYIAIMEKIIALFQGEPNLINTLTNKTKEINNVKCL